MCIRDRLKGISFETAIIERYRRRESSVEEALIEMYLAGVSVRRVEDITEDVYKRQGQWSPVAGQFTFISRRGISGIEIGRWCQD